MKEYHIIASDTVIGLQINVNNIISSYINNIEIVGGILKDKDRYYQVIVETVNE